MEGSAGSSLLRVCWSDYHFNSNQIIFLLLACLRASLSSVRRHQGEPLSSEGSLGFFSLASLSSADLGADTGRMSGLRALLGYTLVHTAASDLLWVHTPNISVAVDAGTGSIAHVNASVIHPTSGSPLNLNWSGITAYAAAGENGILPIVSDFSASACGDAVCVSASWLVRGQQSNGVCCEQYNVTFQQRVWPLAGLPGGNVPSAIGWSTSFTSTAPVPWRTSLVARMNLSKALPNGDAAYWAPRGGNHTNNAAFAYEDVLRVITPATSSVVNTSSMQYGNNMLCDPSDAACCGQIFSVPVTFHASTIAGAGIGLVAAMDDEIFGMSLDASLSGASFSRLFNRLGGGRQVNASFFIVPVAGTDWRPLFAWSRAAFPRFFLPVTLLDAAAMSYTATAVGSGGPATHYTTAAAVKAQTPLPPPLVLSGGLGLYSCANVADMNITQLRRSGATHNWDAHFWWPYIGMYLPPISPADASWATNTGSGEEGNCGATFKHGQLANVSLIKQQYIDAAAAGILTLVYFNLVEYGENIKSCMLPSPITPNPANDWMNATQFLADHMPDAVFPSCPNTGWQDGTDLDPAAASFANFLVSQAQLHVDALGEAFYGFAIDRLDHLAMFTHYSAGDPKDDGLAWCGGPCVLLLIGWTAALQRVQAIVHAGTAPGARAITGNYVGFSRVDSLQYLDGVNSEDYSDHLLLVYAAGLSTTGKPLGFIWTYQASEVLGYQPNPDAYFAQHAIHKLAPYAPVLGNDHSIQPDPSGGSALQDYYSAWGPVFDALRGGCWWLAPDPVLVESSVPLQHQANGFTVGGGCTDPSSAGGNGPVGAVVAVVIDLAFASAPGATVTVSLADAFGGAPPAACEALVPGGNATWAPVPLPVRDGMTGRWHLQQPLPMARGAAVLRCLA